MGIKIDKVRCDGKELKITEYDTNKIYGCLKCYYCNADVSFVNSTVLDFKKSELRLSRKSVKETESSEKLAFVLG